MLKTLLITIEEEITAREKLHLAQRTQAKPQREQDPSNSHRSCVKEVGPSLLLLQPGAPPSQLFRGE